MPTPTYTLRLPRKTQDDIAQLAKVYGSPNPRAFAREVLEVMVSGSEVQVHAFLTRLFEKVTGQMALEMTVAQVPVVSVVSSAKPDTLTRTRKKRRRRARAT